MSASGTPSGQRIGKRSAEPAGAPPPIVKLPRVGEGAAPSSGRLPRVPAAPPSPPIVKLPRVGEPAPIAIDLPPALVAPADPVLQRPAGSPRPGEAAEPLVGGALVVVCPDPSQAQAEALSKVVNKTVYEVKLRFKDPLPRVVLTGAGDEVAAAAEALQAAGVDAMAFEAEAILSGLRPFKVQQVRFEGEAHVVLGGPRGEVRLDLGAPSFLAVGNFDFSAKAIGSMAEARELVRFAHLYAGDWGDPLELLEDEIKDWTFLGADLAPVRRQNYERLLSRLTAPGGVVRDDLLLQHSGRLASTTPDQGGGTVGLAEKSNLRAADTVSRVLYHRWRVAAGHGGAALAAAVEVLSTREAPEARVAERFGGGPTGGGGDDSYTARGGAVPGPRPTSGRLLVAPGPAPEPGARPPSGRFEAGAARTASGRLPCRPPGASQGDDTPLPLRTRAAPPPPPPPTGVRRADGTVYCPTCKLPRVVNHFGRCVVCGFFIAAKAEGSSADAFLYHLGLWWRLPTGVLFLALGGTSVVVVPKLGVLLLLVGFLFVVAWAAEYFFGVTIRVRDYIRLR